MSLLLGAGLNVLGSVAGAIGSARAQKKADGMIAAQKAKNQAWYDRKLQSELSGDQMLRLFSKRIL